MKKADVVKAIKPFHKELRGEFFVESLSLFGSVARDEARPDSDVDLLVEFTQPVGLFTLIGLKNRLEEILGCPVDLGTRRSLKTSIGSDALEDAVRVA